MATRAASPRRSLTAEEKYEYDLQFNVTVKRFGEILTDLKAQFNALVILNGALSSAGPGAYLNFPYNGTYVPFKKNHMRSANASFAKELKDLKHYFRVSKKKSRKQVKPESFSGTYSPVYAAPALRYFFNNSPALFGKVDPLDANSDDIMDHLAYAKAGYFLRNTSTMLFYMHAHAQGLQGADNAQFSSSDKLMMDAFAGNIPAAFFAQKVDGKQPKMSMTLAVKNARVDGPLNTYQVMELLYPQGSINKFGDDVSFKPEKFHNYYYQNLAAYNYYSKPYLQQAQDYIATREGDQNLVDLINGVTEWLTANPDGEASQVFTPEQIDQYTSYVAAKELADANGSLADPEYRKNMLEEHNLVKAVGDRWKQILEPGRKVTRDQRKKAKDGATKRTKAAPKR